MATELLPVPVASGARGPQSPPGVRGLAWSVHKKPMFVTTVASASNLRELRTSRTEYPVYKFELTFEFLDERNGKTELEQIMGFFMTMRGRWGAWLYQDPTDYLLTGAVLGTGDGGTTGFTVMKYLGGFSDPIGQIDQAVLATFANTAVDTSTEAVLYANHGFESGYGPVMVTNPGAVPTGLTASQPYWLVKVDANHFAFATSKANALAGTKINLTAQGSGTNTLSNTIAVYNNGTLVSVADYSIANLNEIIFDVAPINGHTLTVDGKYYFVCRFQEDEMDFEEFMYNLWTLNELNFQSILG